SAARSRGREPFSQNREENGSRPLLTVQVTIRVETADTTFGVGTRPRLGSRHLAETRRGPLYNAWQSSCQTANRKCHRTPQIGRNGYSLRWFASSSPPASRSPHPCS